MRKGTGLLFILVTSTFYSFAQNKQTTSVQQVWLGYFNQTRFSNKFGAWADLHIRTKEDFFTNFSQGIVRVGLTYYVHDATKITAGYAFVNHFPAEGHKNISQPEHRPNYRQVTNTGARILPGYSTFIILT